MEDIHIEDIQREYKRLIDGFRSEPSITASEKSIEISHGSFGRVYLGYDTNIQENNIYKTDKHKKQTIDIKDPIYYICSLFPKNCYIKKFLYTNNRQEDIDLVDNEINIMKLLSNSDTIDYIHRSGILNEYVDKGINHIGTIYYHTKDINTRTHINYNIYMKYYPITLSDMLRKSTSKFST